MSDSLERYSTCRFMHMHVHYTIMNMRCTMYMYIPKSIVSKLRFAACIYVHTCTYYICVHAVDTVRIEITLSFMTNFLVQVEVVVSPQPVAFSDGLEIHGFLGELF